MLWIFPIPEKHIKKQSKDSSLLIIFQKYLFFQISVLNFFYELFWYVRDLNFEFFNDIIILDFAKLKNIA